MLKIKLSRKAKEKSCVFWWEPKGGHQNAGDHLSKIIVQQMLVLKDKEILDKKNKSNKLLAIGSVMHFANEGDTIWGAGINGKIREESIRFQSVDVRAVRGPLTRDFLMKRGIDVPEIYGDPGLLLPMFFSRDTLLNFESPQNDYIIIPHMNEDLSFYEGFQDKLVTAKQGALSFTKDIVNSKFVISGSLHGLIIAEAYGIPAVYLDNNSGEDIFKYNDYYYGTGRSNYPVVKKIKDAFSVEPAAAIDLKNVIKPLIKAFPYDLW